MAGHVYLIGSRKFHWYKIGKSNNAAIRISDLGILLPFRIEVIAVWKADNHHELERLLHAKYAMNRINGEWFTFSGLQVDALALEMSRAKIDVCTTFSNMERDQVNQEWKPASENKTGWQARLNKVVKEKYALEERLKIAEAKLAEQNLSIQ